MEIKTLVEVVGFQDICPLAVAPRTNVTWTFSPG